MSFSPQPPATCSSAEIVDLFDSSLSVGLNFGKIFDFEEGDSGEKESEKRHEDGAASPPQPEIDKGEGEREG